MMYRRIVAVLSVIALGSCAAPGSTGTASAAKPAAVPAAAPSAATTGPIGVPPDPDVLSIVHQDTDGRRSPLLDPRGMPIYDDLGHGISPTITIDRINTMGYDIVLDFHNTGRQPAQLGRINVGIITLGPEFSWLNLNRRSSFVTESRREFTGQSRAYPGSFYSPVGVLHNDDFAVGVSLLYDLLQDRHSVQVRIAKEGGRFASGPGGAGFSIGFDLGNRAQGGGNVEHPATLYPGEERQYRVAVRAMKLDRPVTTSGPQEWLETIEPYRQHFDALYGGVTYERDARPVRARSIGGPGALRDNNRMGFIGSQTTRPNLAGFGPVVTDLIRPSGFERSMLWHTGGLYYNNRENNFPSRFLSQLLTTEKLSTAFDERVGLPRIPASGHQLGLWWGRASRVSRSWDSPHWEPLDLSKPDRVQLAMNELRLAREAGATVLGLDAFMPSEMPVWQQYEWLLTLRRMHPDLTLVVEPMGCDVLHTLGPTFMIAWRGGDRTGQPETRFRLHHAHHLADFLIPGHEIWGFFRYDGSRMPRNPARVQQDAEYIAQTGHVPVLSTFEPLLDGRRGRAEPTWLRTVPDRLKTDAHRSATPPVIAIDGGGDASDTTPDDNGGFGDGGFGDGNGDPGTDGGKTTKDDGTTAPATRPFMLPNGRVIMLPVYESR